MAPTSEEIKKLERKTLSVDALLELFGVTHRTFESVAQITLALEAEGLTTVPSFATLGLEHEVCLMPAFGDSVLGSDAEPGPEDDDTEEDLPTGILPQQSMRVRAIPSAIAGLHSLPPNAPPEAVISEMIAKKRTHVAVVSGHSTLHGVITWSQIGAKQAFGNLTTAKAMDQHPPVCRASDELLAVLPRVIEHGYIVVREDDDSLSGIVTAADVAAQFDVLARPFFALGEIEWRLRRCLANCFTAEEITAAGGKGGEVDEMTFHQYQTLLSKPEAWEKLPWTQIDRDLFIAYVDAVRIARNNVFHFKPVPWTAQHLDRLNSLLGLLRHADLD